MDEIVLRFGQAGRLCLNGAKFAGKYIDCTHASGQTRFQRNIRVTLKQVRQSENITNMYCLKS